MSKYIIYSLFRRNGSTHPSVISPFILGLLTPERMVVTWRTLYPFIHLPSWKAQVDRQTSKHTDTHIHIVTQIVLTQICKGTCEHKHTHPIHNTYKYPWVNQQCFYLYCKWGVQERFRLPQHVIHHQKVKSSCHEAELKSTLFHVAYCQGTSDEWFS